MKYGVRILRHKESGGRCLFTSQRTRISLVLPLIFFAFSEQGRKKGRNVEQSGKDRERRERRTFFSSGQPPLGHDYDVTIGCRAVTPEQGGHTESMTCPKVGNMKYWNRTIDYVQMGPLKR